MSSRCLDRWVRRCRRGLQAIAAAALMAWAAVPAMAQAQDAAESPSPTALRVCVDPDNLPYSRADGSGYEPALARVLADALHLPLELHWQPMRRGVVRKTLEAGQCNALLTVPAGFERVQATRPYYRSS